MNKFFCKLLIFASTAITFSAGAQLFRNRDRMDNLQDFDEQKFSWGFFLAGNNFDYKIVLNPTYGMYNHQNLVESKPSYGFGAGLIGRMRVDASLDLRVEPSLQFVERQLTFNTQSNDQYFSGTSLHPAFTPLVLSDAYKVKNVKSTYLDIPVLLEYHGDRWYNSRPYAAAGFDYIVNLQSNSKSEDDNQQGIFRSTTTNFAWTAEIGMQFYFNRFKLTPGFRGTFVLNNELVADNAATPPYWTAAMNSIHTRALMFVLKFE